MHTVPLLLTLLAAVAACGRPQRSAPVPTAAPTQSPSPAPSATIALSTHTVHFTTADGVQLAGTLYGQGSRAVILSNEGNNATDPWRPVAQLLAVHGYLVLSYAYRPTDAAFDGLAAHALADLGAAVSFMRARPITKLILLGASLGALVSLKAATTLRCDGLVAISAPLGYQNVWLSDADVARLVMPKLFVTSADNQPFAGDTLHLYAVSPEPKARLVYPGNAHGTSLFAGISGADLLPALLRFVQRSAPPGVTADLPGS